MTFDVINWASGSVLLTKIGSTNQRLTNQPPGTERIRCNYGWVNKAGLRAVVRRLDGH